MISGISDKQVAVARESLFLVNRLVQTCKEHFN